MTFATSRQHCRSRLAVDRSNAPERSLISTGWSAQGSYDELINDDDVDALYIATPHPQHLHPALAAIKAGKAVLIEKTFTATVAGAEEIIQAARDQEVFVMEAMWTRFQPAIVAAWNSSPTG